MQMLHDSVSSNEKKSCPFDAIYNSVACLVQDLVCDCSEKHDCPVPAGRREALQKSVSKQLDGEKSPRELIQQFLSDWGKCMGLTVTTDSPRTWQDKAENIMTGLRTRAANYERTVNGRDATPRESGWDKARGEVWNRDLSTCAVCKRHLGDNAGELGHIVDYSMGGSHEAENLAVMCYPCNRLKPPHASVEEYEAWIARGAWRQTAITAVKATTNDDALLKYLEVAPLAAISQCYFYL